MARQKYETILTLRPSHADSLVNIGNMIHRMGHLEDAEKYYRKALWLYEVDSTKTIDQVCRGLEKAVVDHKFGVMMVHNLKETMKKKGVEFAEDRDIMKRKLV